MLFDTRSKLEFKLVVNFLISAVTQLHKDIVIAFFAETNLSTLSGCIYGV